MAFAPCNANVLLAAVIALSAAIAFVAALRLYARCLLQRRAAGADVAGNPHALHRPPDGYEIEVVSVVSACGREAGLDAKELGALPVFMWESSAQEVGVVAEQCAVCLGEMEDGELGRLLPACRHVFHVGCIDAWFLVSSTCPVCRTAVRAEEEAAAPAAGVSPVS